jgi:hypothetical protein
MFIFTPFPSCLGGVFHVDVVVFLVFACIFIFTFALVYLIHTDESLDFGVTKRHIDSNDPISQATQVASSPKKKKVTQVASPYTYPLSISHAHLII